MSDWKPRPSGLFVPAAPLTYGPRGPVPAAIKKASPQFWLRDRRRRIVAGTTAPPGVKDLGPWELHNLEKHLLGRREESVRVLLGVAVLRKLELVGRDGPVACSGAEYQRGKGNKAYVAAHRFPGNPTPGNWSLPHFARTPRLQRALERPLEKTDYLPVLMNYADRLFESRGACDAVEKAVGFILHEQKPQTEINLNLIRHAAITELFTPYREALESALSYAGDHDGQIQPIDPALLQHLSQTWFSGNSQMANGSIEVVQYTLAHSLAVSITSPAPFMLAPATMTEYAARLETLGKEPS
jgi:hypothetical protein